MKNGKHDVNSTFTNKPAINQNASLEVIKLGKASVLTKGTGHMGAELFGKWGK